MNISELNIKSMKRLLGDITLLSTDEKISNINITLSNLSKEKLTTVLLSHKMCRENQDLVVDEMYVERKFDDLLQKGQSALVKKDDCYYCTSQPDNPARFKGIFKTTVEAKTDSSMIYLIEIYMGNFDFDFSNSKTEKYEKEIIYRNVALTIYPSKYAISVIEDDE